MLMEQIIGAISIHAPPRGATTLPKSLCIAATISIHAPPRGATPPKPSDSVRLSFQFTPLREGRQMKGKLGVGFDTFQFTPLREGRRGWMLASTSAARTFQFTPLREGRHKVKSGSTAPTAFQFTPLREGRRPANRHRLRFVNISIHAPPRGATLGEISGNRT